MMAKRLALVVLLCWNVVSATAAEPEKEKPPAIILRLSSFQDFIGDCKYVASLEGHDEVAKNLDESLERFTGKDHGGIDIKRPVALYALADKNGVDLQPFLLIPVTDERKFRDFLGRYLGAPEADRDGIYRVPPVFIPVLPESYLRFAEGYAYISLKRELLAKDGLARLRKSLTPDRPGSLVIVLNLEQLPAQYKDMPMRELKNLLGRPQGDNAAETDVQRKLRLQVAKSITQRLEEMVKEGSELSLQFGVDRKADELFGEVNLAGKPGSPLAKTLTELGQSGSRFAGLAATPAATALLLHWKLPEDVTAAVRPAVDEAIRRVMMNAAAETVREKAVKLVEALDPTLRAGELDTGFRLQGPGKDNHYSLAVGLRLRQGMKIDAAVRDLIRSLPQRDRDRFKFDAARTKAGGIHRADVQDALGEKVEAMFGRQPVYYTIRDDAAWLALGPEALNVLKEAVAAPPQPGLPLDYQVHFARLAPLLPGDAARVRNAAEKAFGKDGKSDLLRVTVGGGDSLKARFTLQAPVVRFLTQTDGKAGSPLWLFR